MAKKSEAGRSERLIADYKASGQTRREYCERHGIPITTLDYHIRHLRMSRTPANLLPVIVAAASKGAAPETQGERGFALVLSNGRRIETDWGFDEHQLARLIRIAGSA